MKSPLVPALLLSTIAAASALECYQCPSSANCGDPFDPTGMETCTSTGFLLATHCRKTVIGDIVTRTCVVGCTDNCSGDTCYHCCNSDLCNGGNTVTTNFVAMGVALVAAFIFSR